MRSHKNILYTTMYAAQCTPGVNRSTSKPVNGQGCGRARSQVGELMVHDIGRYLFEALAEIQESRGCIREHRLAPELVA